MYKYNLESAFLFELARQLRYDCILEFNSIIKNNPQYKLDVNMFYEANSEIVTNVRKAKTLVKLGLSVSSYKKQLLYVAIKEGRIGFLKYLLSLPEYASINQETKNDFLMFAVEHNGFPRILKHLIGIGAIPNRQMVDGEWSLFGKSGDVLEEEYSRHDLEYAKTFVNKCQNKIDAHIKDIKKLQDKIDALLPKVEEVKPAIRHLDLED